MYIMYVLNQSDQVVPTFPTETFCIAVTQYICNRLLLKVILIYDKTLDLYDLIAGKLTHFLACLYRSLTEYIKSKYTFSFNSWFVV